MFNVGVLSIQGSVAEHLRSLTGIQNVNALPVKTSEDIKKLDALILPGGESTAIGKLLKAYDLIGPIKQLSEENKPIWGTCAGMILLAKEIENEKENHIALMDICVRRNAYGSQLDSSKTDYLIPEVSNNKLPLVFIRAPYIIKASENVKILAELNGHIIAARQDNLLVTSFHPELTDDLRFHKYFINMIK